MRFKPEHTANWLITKASEEQNGYFEISNPDGTKYPFVYCQFESNFRNFELCAYDLDGKLIQHLSEREINNALDVWRRKSARA